MNKSLQEQAEILSQKIRRNLITTFGRLAKDATEREIFHALSHAIREEVMINWTATARTLVQNNVRRVYYISMEYLPGRLLSNNLANLRAQGLVKQALQLLGKDYPKIVDLEPDPGLGNGGLGRLASCLLDSLATKKYPATAFGLKYQYGIFEQQFWDGEQVEKPDCWLLNENPWEYRRDRHAKIVKFSGVAKERPNSFQESVLDLYDYDEVRALPFDFPIIGYAETREFSVNTLRLWSTKESPHNFHLQRYNAGLIGPAAENTALTDVLYPNDNHETGKRIRLKQEFLLVSASLQDIIGRHLYYYPDLSEFADKVRIQINDTHPALMIAELMRVLTKNHHFSWKKAWETTQEIMSYTNHTILSEALEEWNKERLSCLLPRQYWIIQRLNQELCNHIRSAYPHDENKVQRLSMIEKGQIRMAHLAIYGSHKVNGVAKLHGEILKNEVFKDFYDLFPEKFIAITNGVTQRHWLSQCNPLLSHWISQRIGTEWLTDFSQMNELRAFADDPISQDEFLEIKKRNKELLVAFIDSHNNLRDSIGKYHEDETTLDVNSLFDVQVKRIHEYKRQLMNALHLIMVYHDLLEDPLSRQVPRTAIFAGKAAAGYTTAKNILHLIYCLSQTINNDRRLQGKLKIVLIENYCVSKAEKIIPAADLSEQISTAGMEASGTGNMKLTINGALTIGTEDGANIEMKEAIGEMWWPFSFGANAQELSELRKTQEYNPWDIYSSHPKIKQALDSLKNGTFAKNEKDREVLSALFDSLMLNGYGALADRFFVLKDLENYYETQKSVEKLYLDPKKWAEIVIQNMGGMGPFSADIAVKNYAEKVWKIQPIPIDRKILEAVRKEYTSHRIL